MATVNIGSLRFDWKGAYNGSTAYAVDDVVSYNGSSYICILASTGNLPTNTTYFQPMATKGTDGTDVGTTLTTQGDILYRDGSGLQRLAAGTNGQLLQTGGSGANPNWKSWGSGSHTHAQFRNATSVVGSITTTSSATTYNTSSDARLKDVTGEARGLEVINELNPVSYNWKADGKADEGLIAQEVQEIVPNAVTGSEEDYYQMDYRKLVVHLVKAVKEQQAQIEALQSEINLLKGE